MRQLSPLKHTHNKQFVLTETKESFQPPLLRYFANTPSRMHSPLLIALVAVTVAAMPSPGTVFAKRDIDRPWIILCNDDSAQYGETCHFDFPYTGYCAQLPVTPGTCRAFTPSFLKIAENKHRGYYTLKLMKDDCHL